MQKVFKLLPYGRSTPSLELVVITPEPTEPNTVAAAWSYAVRYTAKGLDLPDYEQAKQLLIERHPSWTLMDSAVASVPVELQLAENDKPE